MMAPHGQVRSHWRSFLGMLASLGEDEIGKRWAAADRHLRDSGVFYRVHEDPAPGERPWPLSHVPLIIAPSEWRVLRDGLIQRAELLEAVLSDAYGNARLVREGQLPAALIAGNPEFLRPLVGVAPRGGAHLRFLAMDLGRAPDGHWCVLGDRAQAPSGAGYALENRLAVARAIPDIYRASRVERLAPFFQAFRAELSALNCHDDSQVCLITPGPLNDTYFEHAYLARYLGFPLVEGEDLTVRESGVFVRTVSGLKRTEVLLRRLDSDFADPLELNARSRLGVPGLVQAVREGRVVIANALGSGLVEARALLSFLPTLARTVLGVDLAVPNVATWWLGQSRARDEVIGSLGSLVVASAFSTAPPGWSQAGQVLAAAPAPEQQAHILEAIRSRGADLVAQEAAALSTLPTFAEGGLKPRPFVLRLFIARVGQGWQVMPGGLVRIADDPDVRAVSLEQGGRTADAWVLAKGPVLETTLLPTPERITIRRATGALPSRTADNLFWVGRYVERAEATLRLLRALINRGAESDEATIRLVACIGALLAAWHAAPSVPAPVRAVPVASAALQRTDLGGSLPQLVGAARSAASVIRDRLSPDAWRALTDLVSVIEAPFPSVGSETAMFERVNAALRIIASFSGLAQENMNQGAGWRFLDLGRRIERVIATCRLVRHFAFDSPGGELDVLLEVADSQITYRRHYVLVAARAPVLDLVMLDPSNPRSVAFQLDRIDTHLAALATPNRHHGLSSPQQIAMPHVTALRTADPGGLQEALIIRIETDMMKLSDVIASTYLTHPEQVGTAAVS